MGDSYDSALADTINGLYKAEVIHRRSWRNRQDVELAALDWVDWYNHKRLLGSIGNIPPAEAEAAHYQQINRLRPSGVTQTIQPPTSHGGSLLKLRGCYTVVGRYSILNKQGHIE